MKNGEGRLLQLTPFDHAARSLLVNRQFREHVFHNDVSI